jgi:DNA-binding NarL/FixJ family response regulator
LWASFSFFFLRKKENCDVRRKNPQPQQAKVLPLVVAGFTNKMIARELDIAEGTVKVHLSAAFSKLGVRNGALAAVRGASEGRTECARRDFDRCAPPVVR